MEAIVLKVMKKYLKLFIKNFTPDNFSLSLLKGEGQLVDLQLNENVIQELLLLPPQLRVTLARCDTLTARVPWTSYKKEPITMAMNTITVQLKEPETIEPMQPQLKKFKKKNKNKRNEVTENMMVEVKRMNLSVSTMRGETLIVDVEDVLVQSTNSNFQPGDLSSIKSVDKEQGTESLFKLITAKSISIKIQDMGGMTYSVIDNIPLKVLFSSKRRSKDWIQLSAKVEVLLGFLQLNWSLSQWHLISELVATFQTILARHAPPPIALEDPKAVAKREKSASKKHKKTSSASSSSTPASTSGTSSPGTQSGSSSPALKRSSNVDPPEVSTPQTPHGDGDLPVPKHSDFTYDFHIDKWRLDLVDNQTQDTGYDSGFQFEGDGLHFGFTASNVNYRPTDENGAVIYSLPIRESIVSVVMNSLQVKEMESFQRRVVRRELCGQNEDIPPQTQTLRKYDKTITSISSDGISERIQIHHYQGPYLLKGNFIFRKPISTDDNPDPLARLVAPDGRPLQPLIGLELNLHLNHFKLTADRPAWKQLIAFLMPPENAETDSESDSSSSSSVIDPKLDASTGQEGQNGVLEIPLDAASSNNNNVRSSSGITKQTDPFAIKRTMVESGKKKLNKFRNKFKLGSNWKNQIKIVLKASDTVVFIPETDASEHPDFTAVAMKLKLGTFMMRNHSDWKTVPHLYDGLQMIDTNVVPEPVTLSGLDHRFSFKMENISCIIIENGVTSSILQPTSISLYLRVSRSTYQLNEKRIPKIDLSFISSDFNYRMTKDQSQYLDFVGKKFLSPERMKDLMHSRVQKIKSVAKKRLAIMKNQNMDKTLTIKNKVEKTLQQYHWNVYVCIQKGVFHLPLQHFLEPKSKMQEIFTDVANAPVSDGNLLTEFKVEMMGVALQNNQHGQSIVFKIGTFEALGIEHPKLTTSTTLRPLPVPEDEYIPSRQADNTNMLITYRRRQKKDANNTVAVDSELDDWLAEVNVRLQGMQVLVLKKKGSSHGASKGANSGLKLPDIQSFITKMVQTLDEKKEDFDNIKKGIKKVKLDLVWGVELGNCEILMGNKSKDNNPYRPKGVIRITDTNRKTNARAYKDIEQELLKKTLESAKSEEDTDYYNNKIAQLQAEIENLKKQANEELLSLKQEYMSLEGKFIQTKMGLADMENENDSLKFELKKYQKK
ncbi:hypothetical protein SAMD00019534_094520 [Acytostelium subglobosum LB1]|uniref:hypothetical protein n=1 Tax=Acytostelium subglobosum LB1 TaxID=1410327 RepID=UPI000644C296|nr:hypothetical protein SAMD00019534_094520 [Acytostelium subglobosum LB1]GAM26277.1 hypothetical protein SAMD00019534_094520 [Acytostelium subglobosum LB1]|eukprot:XP_012750831.1 hypothetical protein SAMD00019534_094520 [Acytostelium subglobosum LB1]